MRHTDFKWPKQAVALLVLSTTSLLAGCNDDSEAEPPSLTEEFGLQVAAGHFYERPYLTPEESAERGFQYCAVEGMFFIAVRSATDTLPKDLTVTAAAVNVPGEMPVQLELETLGIEMVDTPDQSWRELFSDQKMPPRESRLHIRGFACLADDSLMRNLKLDMTLTTRSGQREAAVNSHSVKLPNG